MTIALRGGTVVTADGEVRADVLVDGGVVSAIGPSLRGDEELDATGCHVLPGFVDLHTHLREPGREEAETIATGSRAGALGGYTALVAMPNTDPAQDSVTTVEFVRSQGRAAGLVEVLPSGCITAGRRGERLAPLADLAAAGVTLFTDDGNGVQDASLMRRALLVARDLGVVLAQHCEVSSLTAGAVMDECACSGELGLPGWPAVAEELMVQRDIDLVRDTGGRIHFLHLSTARSVALVRAAKAEGLAVTAEVAPHHLLLDHGALRSFDPVYKVNPPLRSPADAAALREGLRDGTIDAVASDHAPHEHDSKRIEFSKAAFGILGLQTSLPIVLELIRNGTVSRRRAIEVCTAGPARCFNLPYGSLALGASADVAIIDPERRWVFDRASVASLSANSPFLDRELRGAAETVLVAGKIVLHDGSIRR